VISDA